MALKKIKDAAFKEEVQAAKERSHATETATEENPMAEAVEESSQEKLAETDSHPAPWTTKSLSSVTSFNLPAISSSGAEAISFPFKVITPPELPVGNQSVVMSAHTWWKG